MVIKSGLIVITRDASGIYLFFLLQDWMIWLSEIMMFHNCVIFAGE